MSKMRFDVVQEAFKKKALEVSAPASRPSTPTDMAMSLSSILLKPPCEYPGLTQIVAILSLLC